MRLGLEGKVAMVAAASKGIGLAAAKELLAEGCRVSICARGRDGLDAALAGLPGAVGTVCDVSSAEDLERWHRSTVESLGAPDVLVTNTGGPPAGNWTEMTDQQWQAGFESTLLNVVRLVRLASPAMRERGWGRIVHVSSLVASSPHPLLPISSTLRAGLSALVRLQALELAPQGITVNSVLPGHTMTDRQTHLAEVRAKREGTTPEAALRAQAEAIPAKRIAGADEIAAAIVFLCSDRASYVTGVNLLVDGGATCAS